MVEGKNDDIRECVMVEGRKTWREKESNGKGENNGRWGKSNDTRERGSIEGRK
jgi:hypothetical protein